MDSVKKENAKLVKQNKTSKDSAKKEAEKLKSELEDIEKKFNEKQEELEAVNVKCKELENNKETLESSIKTLTKEKDNLTFVSKEQITMIESIKKQLAEVKKNHETAVVKSEDTITTTTTEEMKSPNGHGSAKKKKDLSITPVKKEALAESTPIKLDVKKRKKEEETHENVPIESTPPPNISVATTTSPAQTTPKSASKSKKSNIKMTVFILISFKVVVSFSGFKDGDKSYSNNFKDDLIKKVLLLNCEVRQEAEFDNKVTHVVTPPNTRTMKTLAAALTHRWLVTPQWVVDSADAGEILPEDKYIHITHYHS